MNPANIKAPHLSKAQIEELATEIRGRSPHLQKLPIDVLRFAEFDLNLEFDFAPIGHLNQDAFLRPNRTGILFNKGSFSPFGNKDRLRFSAAHELGHFFLHEDLYGRLDFETVEQWVAFIGGIPIVEYQWIEWQADEFAGQFLMPTKELSGALDETIADAEREGLFGLGKEELLAFCSRAMRTAFEVSFPAMQTRIRKSTLWPHSKIASLPD